MRQTWTRREFLAAGAATLCSVGFAQASESPLAQTRRKHEFQVSVLTDEISQDFDKACKIAAEEFGLKYVELRAMWNKNVTRLENAELAKTGAILKKYNLGVTGIAGPLFKVDWPGAPKSKFSPARDNHLADWTFDEQPKVLQKEIELANRFGTKHIRIFDFWRLEDPKPFREAINTRLLETADIAQKHGLVLVMENEHACNTANAKEAAETLKGVQHPAFKLVWDPGNSFFSGEKPFPDGYKLLPFDGIGHVHCKDARMVSGKPEWEAMGKGEIDWSGQFAALVRDGYRGPVTLETHWKGAGSTEESSRQSMKGMLEMIKRAEASA